MIVYDSYVQNLLRFVVRYKIMKQTTFIINIDYFCLTWYGWYARNDDANT